MDEYISREATVKAFCEKCKGYYDGHCVHRGECDIDVIQTAPAADVQPVKRGKWLSRCEGDIYEFGECSECGNMESCETPYCAQCGARMDGDADA